MKKVLFYFAGLLQACACTAPHPTQETERASEPIHEDTHEHHAFEEAPMEEDDYKKSKYTEVHEFLGSTHFTIKYTAPVTKNRVIFGGLVAYNEVWVTGAHQATSITFDKAVAFANQWVEPGTYAIFTIPGESEWTFILNSRYNQHLADEYSEAEDVIRLQVLPSEIDEKVERLSFAFVESEDKSYLRISWDNIALDVPITLLNE